VALAILLVAPASAHQPYFEEQDIEFGQPWPIADPTVSTVVYATLDSPVDVDYFTFEGQAGQDILLEITIPQIEGQEEFAPIMALFGPGLPAEAQIPATVQHDPATGALMIPPAPGPAEEFYEPFSRTSYWERQSTRASLPESGRYVVAIWHPDGKVGRYGFVIGDKERLGGDLLGMATKMRSYWTPYEYEGSETLTPTVSGAADLNHGSEEVEQHSHDKEAPANPFGNKPASRWPEGMGCSSP
jgi:hypothetical protein